MCNRSREDPSDARRLIKTHLSDEEYPWPPGKAPWSVEQGGEGESPGSARAARQGGTGHRISPIALECCGEINEETLERFLDYGEEMAKVLLRDAQGRRRGEGEAATR